MMSLKKHRVSLAFIGTLLIGLLLSAFIFLFTSLVHDDQGFRYEVLPGATMKSVAHDLYQQNIIRHPHYFQLLVYLKGNKHELKAGEYLFPKGTTANSLLKQITTGSGLYYHEFAIIPGWSFGQLRQALAHEDNLKHDSGTLSDADLMKYMGRADLKPEGQFYPDTYYFLKGSNELVLLKRAFQRMQTKLNEAWQQREAGLPFSTAEDALNAASLVEKEAKVNKDRPLIAGVIINRIRKNMPLQIDPTVIYAAGARYTGVITRQNLLSKSPYNTYIYKGLPPTPIAFPSIDSLEAVLHPAHNNYLYFVADNVGNGEHQFSATLAEHNDAVAKAKYKKLHPDFFNEQLIRRSFDAKIYNN